MKILVHLRDTTTGYQGVYEMGWDYPDGLYYMFGDGNYSCDCNRAIFLADASEEFDAVDDEIPCSGQMNRIVIDKITDDSGNLLYRDEVAA